MESGDESYHNIIYTEMLEDNRDGSQYHPNVNRREVHYKIHDRIKQRQLECRGALKDKQKMGRGLQKIFSMVVKEI